MVTASLLSISKANLPPLSVDQGLLIQVIKTRKWLNFNAKQVLAKNKNNLEAEDFNLYKEQNPFLPQVCN